MGRRKERRIAALASGRRVKLDLFAEPSGDLGSSSTQDEVGGADEAKNQAGLPSSPSSSGKQPENPLVLLGQYSDDELDDGSSEEQNQPTAEDSFVFSDDGQEKVAAGQGIEDSVIEEQNRPTVETAEQLQTENGSAIMDSAMKSEEGGVGGILATGVDDVEDENCLTGRMPTAATSDIEVGNVTSGWKMVWHEESNQYYYWNIATGETSWTVPDVSLQTSELMSDTDTAGEKEKANNTSNATYPNCEVTEGSEHKAITETLTEDYGEDALHDKKMDPDTDQNYLKICSPSAMGQNPETLLGTNVSFEKSNDVLLMDENAKNFHSLKPGNNGSYALDNLSSRLIEHCELLLERLNNVKGSKDHPNGHVRMHTYIFEVEMRLADMKSLACHGSSLLPFWELFEKRIQQLEANINKVLQELEAEKVNDFVSTLESECHVANANSSEKRAVPASDDFVAPEPAWGAEVQNNVETSNDVTTGDKNVPLGRDSTGYPGNTSGATEVDMDVDMEVEDASPASNLDVAVTSEQLTLPTPTPENLEISSPGAVYGVPPPPDEEWIPPPLPDEEPFLPPPPDEPPEISYSQPSDMVSIPSFPYVEQYNVYPSSHFHYVAPTGTNVAGSNLYALTEGCQPTISQPSLYFEALPDTYNPATLAVNPVETGLYYGLQDPLPRSSIQNPISDSIGSLGTNADLRSVPLSRGEGVVSATGDNSLSAVWDPSSSQAPLKSSATTSVTESISVSSIPSSTATLTTSTASKAQSKVPRKKKRTVAVVSSLRSNKKVSSLVDKWKAAKEELLEEEKEPENALEMLERKRQREIEEWRKQQISSGEAKDNANFQPLGGDWRERVKRKRAQLAKESVQSPSDGVSEVNTQPDLDEISRNLPPGWQAFWDDSSKQVYYGNASTSETSWIRPTD